MGNFGNKLFAAFGLERTSENSLYDETQEDYELYEIPEQTGGKEKKKAREGRYRKVSRFYDDRTNILIYKPEEFDQANDIVSNLERNMQVVLNLDEAKEETAHRIVDYVSGAVYALRGSLCQIADNIYIVTTADAAVETGGEQEISQQAAWL